MRYRLLYESFFDNGEGGLFNNLSNLGYYVWRRQNWMVDPRFYIGHFRDIEIDSPVFLLGTHGGGLTLVSRMLRRNSKAVSVTGSSDYWVGADEMQNVFGPYLPQALTGINNKVPNDDIFGAPRGWLYATDRLLHKYRMRRADADKKYRGKLEKIIKYCLFRYGRHNESARFIDKSQVYTVKVSFLDALLSGTNPRYVLITRDPYASCYRAALGIPGGMRKIEHRFDFKDRLKLASQHWSNSVLAALEDSDEVSYFTIKKFEDIISQPAMQIRNICEFVDLPFEQDMVPAESHEIPLGSRHRSRWYPLNVHVNHKYFEMMNGEDVDIMYSELGELADELGYGRPILRGG